MMPTVSTEEQKRTSNLEASSFGSKPRDSNKRAREILINLVAGGATPPYTSIRSTAVLVYDKRSG